MVLSKSVLLSFMLLIKYSHGGKGCTISDILLEQFENGEYGIYSGHLLTLFNSTRLPIIRYVVTPLAYYGYCLGFSTETLDTVVFSCPGKDGTKDGCFQVLTPRFNAQNNTVFFVEKEKRICVSKLDESCVGLKINDEITIILNCGSIARSSQDRVPYVPYSFARAIPDNAPPRRF